MIIGNKKFNTAKKTYIMGILNLTPDSFYDGGIYNNINKAVERAITMHEEGAEIIDIGGESTRPGHTQISVNEEINRIIPIIKSIKKEIDIPLSIDTYKAEVAEESINAGADLVNDIWGLKYDKNMADVVSNADIPICLMHNKVNKNYGSFFDEVIVGLNESINIALEHDIPKNNIMIDPGIGFAKDTDQNLEIMARLQELKKLNYPVLLGVSRKSVIGNVLNILVEERLIGTVVLNMIGYLYNIAFLRVHDVKEHVQMLKMLEAISKFQKNHGLL